jgi:serine/threonine-protein kinase
VCQASQSAISLDAVRQQVEKILAHGLFIRSERMARFLRFVVQQALAGKAADLKEYLIGVEVFDRRSSYDPRVDPIVRVEARRLRSKLKAYYESAGRSDSVLVEFVSGSYQPHFSLRSAAELAPPPQPPARPAPDPVTIAVLPFVNLSANSEDEYFSDGLTEELIHALTKLGEMRVVAWDSAARLRGRQQDVAAIRHQLNVGTALTGSVRIAGPTLRVRAQLIDTADGVYLWSETFDRQLEDVFAIQEEIARAIVKTLRLQLSGGADLGLDSRGRTTISAYDWYLRGRHFGHRRSPDGLRRALQCFEAAVEADPSSGLAHAGLADACSVLVDYGLANPDDVMPRARAAALRALSLAPDLAEAHVSLAFIRGLYEWEWEDAERLYLRALALNPGYASAYHWLGTDHYALTGRFEEAMATVETAIALDPLSSIIREGRAYTMMLMRRFDAAIAAYAEILRTDPTFYKAYTSMGRAYAQQGRYAEALEMLEKGRSMAGDMPTILGAIGQVSGLAGDRERARGLLAQLHEQARHAYVPGTCFALIHQGLGERERALDWMERSCARRELPVAACKVHPAYDDLRGEPRFQAILRTMRLA